MQPGARKIFGWGQIFTIFKVKGAKARKKQKHNICSLSNKKNLVLTLPEANGGSGAHGDLTTAFLKISHFGPKIQLRNALLNVGIQARKL